MKALITGGFGFIGGYFCKKLIESGWNVRILDIEDRSHKPEFNLKGLEYVIGDIRDYDAVVKAMSGVDVVIHLAAKHRFFGITEEEFRSVNVNGTDTILRAARETGLKDFIFYSSVAVYGDQQLPTTDETTTLATLPYGLTKLEGERLAKVWVKENDERRALIIRPTVVYGPRNRGNMFRLIRQIESGFFLPVGDGNNIKSVAYVENLVDATCFAYQRVRRGVEIYNYADEPHLPFNRIVSLIYRFLNRRQSGFVIPLSAALFVMKPIDLFFGLRRKEFVITSAIKKMNKSTHHQALKIREEGFTPEFTIEDGLLKMVDWYMKNKIEINNVKEVHE